jgi:hypothetical protein
MYNGSKKWVAISELVPGRAKKKSKSRWLDTLSCKIDETTARVGKWTTDEDSTLKDAVEMHYGEPWAAISALVPSRTILQCRNRWNNALESKNNETTARKGKWTTDEDSTLKDAVEKHSGKNWVAISALVPGRTKQQCRSRWVDVLDSKSDETTACRCYWTKDEDSTLTDAVEMYNGSKKWVAISELFPGRTKKQCLNRWVKYLAPSRITITEKERGTTNEVPALR